ncbi:MAG: DUF3035 domain-containing protein [Sulfitobacter sp.]
MRRIATFVLITVALSACANKGLRELRSNSSGPDEFIVAPAKPLQAPDDYKSLPSPTPGQANLTDTYPVQEAAVATGGRAQADGGAIPGSDGALVQHASRFGVTQDIRPTLAASDADFRRRKARFTQYRIVPVDRYNQAYKRQAIDAKSELRRWRSAGARTPTSPP